MIWRVTVVLSIMFLILAVINFNQSIVCGIFTTLLIICTGSLYYLKINKSSKFLYWIFAVLGTSVIIFSLNNIPSYTHFVDFLWVIVIILSTYIGLGKRVGLLITIINFLNIIYFYLFNLNINISTLQPLSNFKIYITIFEVMLALACVTFLINQFVDFNTYYGKKLEKNNQELLKINNENLVLVKEIHHRVKNNLQIIISLLRLQKGELKSDEAKRHFNEAINRIMVMSLIHKKLYQKVDMAQIEVQPYLYDLSKDVIRLSNMGLPITCEVSSEIKKIGLKTIVPLGLIINELLSNSIKHAFRREGFISITILKNEQEDELVLIYVDDGNWIEPKENTQSFGLGLIETLTEQLEGSFIREQSEYTFRLKNLDD